MKKTFAILMVLLVAMCAVFASGEQEGTSTWPSEPIHIVGQSAAGSGPDLFIRQLQPQLQEALGTSIVVENKPGSGGKLASDYVWKSDPDGYTLLAHSSPLTTVTQISKDADFSIKDMKHIVVFDAAPYAVLVKADSPINNIEDLIEYSKNNNVSNANSGIGGAMFLQSRIMADTLGIEYNEVPYNGSQPCTLAVMNGDTTFTVTAYDTAVNNDQVKNIALLSDERLDIIPDVPTIVEQGYKFPFLVMRRGVVAPSETPDEVVATLVDAFKFATDQPSFKEYTETNGINVDLRFGEDYQKLDDEYFETIMKYISYL
jgi:tripartite-type tricarboxylate transporter receptor subunit TctC